MNVHGRRRCGDLPRLAVTSGRAEPNGMNHRIHSTFWDLTGEIRGLVIVDGKRRGRFFGPTEFVERGVQIDPDATGRQVLAASVSPNGGRHGGRAQLDVSAELRPGGNR